MNQEIPYGYRESAWGESGLCLISGEVFVYKEDGLSKIEIKLNGAFHGIYRSVMKEIAIPIEKVPTEFTDVLEWISGCALTPICRDNISDLCKKHLDPKIGDRFEVTVKKLPKEGDN